MYVRLHLVRRVSADHVEDGETASGVSIHPSIESEDGIFVDDNDLAVGDEVVDVAGVEDLVAIHVWSLSAEAENR